MKTVLSGIFPVLPTPFRNSGEVDGISLARLVDFAVESGVAGVVFPGFASEVETLTEEERADLLGIVAKRAEGKLTVIAGASSASVVESVAHGKRAAALGINMLMIQPPKSLGDDAKAVVDFLSGIVAELPDAEIILQNAPAPRGSDLSPNAIVEIVKAVPQVVYVKEETLPAGPAISHILAHRPNNLAGVIGGGGARYILDEYTRGACAAMPALELAPEHVALDSAWRMGDRKKARHIYVETLPLLVLQAVYRMRLTKHILMRRGLLDNIIVRAPTPDLDPLAAADIDDNLALLKIAKILPESVSA